MAFRLQVFDQGLRLLEAESRRLSVLAYCRNRREVMRLDDAEANPRVCFDLVLQTLGEGFVALPRDHRQRIHLETTEAFSLLVDAETQAAPDSLPPFALGLDVTQRADLKNVGIVPSLAQRRMREDELERCREVQEFLLLFHDQIVSALRVVTIYLVVLGGVGPTTLPVDREVTVVDLLGGRGQIRFSKKGAVVWMIGEMPILFLEHQRIIALDGIARFVLAPITIHGVNEEQAEHLDSPRAQAFLLIKMLADGSADHLAPDGVGIHVTRDFSQPEVLFAARHSELDEFVASFDADFADAMVAIDGAAGHVFEIVAVLDIDFPAPDSSRSSLDIELDLGADDAAPIARRHDPDIGLVVGVFDGGRRDLDLLHQLAFVGIDGIETIDHVVLIYMRRGVTQRTERIDSLKGFPAAPRQTPVHTLRLVDDQDRAAWS